MNNEDTQIMDYGECLSISSPMIRGNDLFNNDTQPGNFELCKSGNICERNESDKYDGESDIINVELKNADDDTCADSTDIDSDIQPINIQSDSQFFTCQEPPSQYLLNIYQEKSNSSLIDDSLSVLSDDLTAEETRGFECEETQDFVPTQIIDNSEISNLLYSTNEHNNVNIKRDDASEFLESTQKCSTFNFINSDIDDSRCVAENKYFNEDKRELVVKDEDLYQPISKAKELKRVWSHVEESSLRDNNPEYLDKNYSIQNSKNIKLATRNSPITACCIASDVTLKQITSVISNEEPTSTVASSNVDSNSSLFISKLTDLETTVNQSFEFLQNNSLRSKRHLKSNAKNTEDNEIKSNQGIIKSKQLSSTGPNAIINVCITGVDVDEVNKYCSNISNISLVEDPNSATHIIIPDVIKRTPKFMIALNCGVTYFLSMAWLESSATKGTAIPITENNMALFTPKDKDKESLYGFNLIDTVKRERNGRLFEGMCFFIDKNVCNGLYIFNGETRKTPPIDDMEKIIKSGGGHVIFSGREGEKKITSAFKNYKKVIFVSDGQLSQKSRLYHQSSFSSANVYYPEFIFNAILKQSVEYDVGVAN